MSSDYIVVLWNVVRLYCLFYGVSSDYIVCSENQDLDSRRAQRGHSIGVPPARKKNKEIRLGMRTRFDNIIILLDTAKLLKQTRLFELNETIIFGDICSTPSFMHLLSSIHPSIHLAIRLSIRPSIRLFFLVGHIFFTFLLWCRMASISLARILLS